MQIGAPILCLMYTKLCLMSTTYIWVFRRGRWQSSRIFDIKQSFSHNEGLLDVFLQDDCHHIQLLYGPCIRLISCVAIFPRSDIFISPAFKASSDSISNNKRIISFAVSTLQYFHAIKFQSTLPERGATLLFNLFSTLRTFQSTLPERGATTWGRLCP